MKKLILAVLTASLFAGCATKDYALYAEAQHKIAQAHAMAETAKYAALAEIAKTGDSAAKVAAVLSIHMNNSSGQRSQSQIAPPTDFGDTALKWTSVLLPTFGQLYAVNRNTAVAMRQSDNQAAIAISTNQTFGTISSAGHAANSSIAASGFSAINTSNTAGFNALGTQSTAAFNALQATGVAGFNALKDTAGMIQSPSPNIAVQGNYNVGDNSGNSGKIAGTTLTDSTATPTVVNQPTPIVVNQPTPTVVNPVVVTQPAPLIVRP